MSSIVGTAVLRRVQTVFPAELLACAFHSSSPRLNGGSRPRRKRQSSRTRLSPISKVGGSSKSVEYAPRQKGKEKMTEEPPPPPFARDEVPHPEATDWFSVRERARVRGRAKRVRVQDDLKPSERANVAAHTTEWASRSPPTSPAPATPPQPHPKFKNSLVADEFDRSVHSEPVKSLPSEFTSPPLMPGLLDSVVDALGPNATPTPIQGLALKHLMYPWKTKEDAESMPWRECLLASETGSGKSLAYMLPMLQDLKTSELSVDDSDAANEDPRDRKRAFNPRAIVLSPTHELSRQLSATAKALVHNIKLRVVCASRANLPSAATRNVTASKMSSMFNKADLDGVIGAHKTKSRPLDVLVGTPNKVLEMFRGHGWNYDIRKENMEDAWEVDEKGRKVRKRKFVVGQPELGLHRVEWVVVDEADVLFDPDFQEQTRLLLSDISRARGQSLSQEVEHPTDSTSQPEPVVHHYPFNFILTSATIPTALASYLETHHPQLKRLVSPNLHHLPSTLRTEHVPWTSGNRNADVEARIKRIWWSDVHQGSGKRSKILVFCNKSTKVEELGRYFSEHGVPNVALTSTAEARRRGNNHHLDGFLRPPGPAADTEAVEEEQQEAKESEKDDDSAPHVLITTSLLSRGLDFSPEIKNVLIVDAPRNMIDFLHRAGRTARAGAQGTVIIFGKSKGRGAGKDKEVKDRISTLRAR